MTSHPSHASPLDIVAIQRHILSQMDIHFWVRRGVCTQIIDNTHFTRTTFQNPSADLQKSRQQSQNASISPKQHQADTAQSKVSSPTATPNLAKINTNEPNVVAPNLQSDPKPTPNLDNKPNIAQQALTTTTSALPDYFAGLSANVSSFGLLGLRYGNWVLLADRAFLDNQSHATWTALANALKSKNPNTLNLQINYPLVANEYPEYQNYEQGSVVLLGFLVRLCHDMASMPLNVAFLTPISQGVSFGESFWRQVNQTTLPSLNEMTQNPKLKNILWHKINANDLLSQKP